MNRRRLLALAGIATVAGVAGVVAGKLDLGQRAAPSSLAPTATAAHGRIRRLTGLGPVVAEFTPIGGPVIWSPDGADVCIERLDGATHVVDVVATATWRRRLTVPGSRPSWSPDGTALALVDPFAPATPPPEATSVVVLDAASGTERGRSQIRAFGLGWSGASLFGVVGGDLQHLPVATAGTATDPRVSCDGGCGTADWSPLGALVVLSENVAPYDVAVHDLTSRPTLVMSLGAIDALVWASRAAALAWSRGGATHVWSPSGEARALSISPSLRPVVWSPQAGLLLCADARVGKWYQWLREDDSVQEVTLPAEIMTSTRLAWSPDGRFIAAILSVTRTASVRIYEVRA